MTYWKTEDFKALQKAWYRRLEASGFQDIEEVIGSEARLKKPGINWGQMGPDPGNNDMRAVCKEEYYRVMSQQLEEAEFKSDVDRLILVKHLEGKDQRKIAAELSQLGLPRSRNTVRYRIRTYEMKWGVRMYTPKQLNVYGRTAMPPKKKVEEDMSLPLQFPAPLPTEPGQILLILTGGVEVHGLRVQDVVTILKEMGHRAA